MDHVNSKKKKTQIQNLWQFSSKRIDKNKFDHIGSE